MKKIKYYVLFTIISFSSSFALEMYPIADGYGAVSLVFHPDGKYVYSINSSSNNISKYKFFYKTGKLEQIGNVSTGVTPTFGAEFSPDGKYFLVTSSSENKIYEYSFNKKNGELTIVRTVDTALEPIQAMFSDDGKFVYIVSLGENAVYQYKFNSSNGEMTPLSPVKFSTENAPTGIGLSNDGKYIYEISSGENSTARYYIQKDGQLEKNEVYKLIGNFPVYSNFDKTGKISLCTNYNSDNLDVFLANVTTGVMESVGSVSAGNYPNSLVVYHKSNEYAYVANEGSNDVTAYILNSDAKNVESIIQKVAQYNTGGIKPGWLVPSPDENYLYVLNSGSNNISSFHVEKNGKLT